MIFFELPHFLCDFRQWLTTSHCRLIDKVQRSPYKCRLDFLTRLIFPPRLLHFSFLYNKGWYKGEEWKTRRKSDELSATFLLMIQERPSVLIENFGRFLCVVSKSYCNRWNLKRKIEISWKFCGIVYIWLLNKNLFVVALIIEVNASLSLVFTSSILFFTIGIPTIKTLASEVVTELYIFTSWQMKSLNG